MSNHDEWRDVESDVHRAGLFGVRWFFIIFIVAAVAGVGIWAFQVATSETKGKGDAVIEKNSASNWTEQQAAFNQLYQDILATDRKITAAKEAWDASPDDAVLRTNYNGLVSHCQTAVGEYNSLAREYLAKDFRDADLPEQINMNDPATDCQEN